MNYRFILGLLTLIFSASSCIPPGEKTKLKDIRYDFKDPLFQKIHNYQDRALADSLYLYFRHPDPTYRNLAALAFGSIRDSSALDSLYVLLSDDIDQVRASAAFAIGQIGAVSAETRLMNAFEQTDTAGTFARANAAILEAVGKCGSPESLTLLATISTYRPSDTLLLEGQAWGIYRYGIRNIVSQEGTKRMVDLVSNAVMPPGVRLIAANYLYRVNNLQLNDAEGPLVEAALRETDPNIRMALCVALGKLKTERALGALQQIYNQEQDYRVICNILRAIGNFEYARAKEIAKRALKSPNPHVAQRAAQYFLEKGVPEEASEYWSWGRTDTIVLPAKLVLYAAANRHLPVLFLDQRNTLNLELRNWYKTLPSPFAKADVLKALAEFGWNLNFIQREGAVSPDAVVRTAGTEALAMISDNPGFTAFFKGSSRSIQRQLGVYFLQAIRKGDVGSVSLAANALRNPARGYRQTLADSLGVLETALKKLSLPKDIETYNDLQKTIDYLSGKPESPAKKMDYTHPIQWELLTTLKSSTAVVETAKGAIVLELMPENAPGSVANFVELAKTGFFNDKVFHRVVANFVIQGGCPRGDGYGSLDYSIRSELTPLHYDREGYVGMASAGNHTEGTQFFITHSPTPHLDGNYSIFARVKTGQDVVDKIFPGDRIIKVSFE